MNVKSISEKQYLLAGFKAGYALTVVAGLLLVATGHTDRQNADWLTAAPLLLLAVFSLVSLVPSLRPKNDTSSILLTIRPCAALTLAWSIYRFFLPALWQIGLLPLAVLCCLFAILSLRNMIVPLAAVLFMEIGLYLSSSQTMLSLLASVAIIIFLGAVFSPFIHPRLSLFFKGRIAQTTRDIPPKRGITVGEPAFLKTVNENITSEIALQLISDDLVNLLQLGRGQLQANTVALLWPTSDGAYALREVSTDRQDLIAGPFPAGSGLIAALQQKDSIRIDAPRLDGPKLPFYKDNAGLGAIQLEKIKLFYHESEAADKRHMQAILTIDLPEGNSFDEESGTAIRLLADQLRLTLNIEKAMRILVLDRDRMHTVCNGLHQLNGVLGLDSVYEATASIVKGLVPFDLMAISLLQEEKHRLVKISGSIDTVEEGEEFAAGDGLVGQVLKRNHWLPAGAAYRDAAPIFSNAIKHGSFRSLLILPLRNEDNAPIGALTVAAAKPNVITKQRRDLLEVVATQVAVKIDLAQAHEKINQLAITDGLTGLINHRTFQHGFNMMLERARRNQCPLCLIICDIDYFKKINDSHGHPFGDKVLKSVADVLAGAVRKVDLAARYGGEEFALLLESADEKGGRRLAERIRKLIEKLVVCDGPKTATVTLSLGLAFFPKDAAEKEQLISYADQALYKAKAAGRNRTVSWSEIKGIKD